MVVENEIKSFMQWLAPSGADWHEGALFAFLVTVVVLGLVALLVGFLVLLIRYGPVKAGDITYRAVTRGVQDLVLVSPRRVMALAWLAVKESWRRQAVVALVIYGLILSFASWYLRTDHPDPAKVQLDFVLSWTTFLMLLQGLLLSAFSLPNDFKSKTIYTVVTKPVRAVDIVLGRIVGFTLVGTVLLTVMGVCSYVFVNRSLSHTHGVAKIENVTGAENEVIGQRGETNTVADHRHEFDVDADGFGEAFSAHGHRHFVDTENDDLVIGGAEDVMRARVPKRGEIHFLDRGGVPKDKGVSVGNEWDYRSFVAGGTNAAAIWTFDNVTEEIFEEDEDGVLYLPIELTVRVFRTHKGDIEESIRGTIQLLNPDNPEETKSSLVTFPAKDMSINSFRFTEELFDEIDQKPINLLDDLVSEDGRLQVMVQCVDGGQYFGFARADCYVRLPEGNTLWNFVKAHLGVWVQLVVVVTIGVMASTFLNGPIAALLTVSFILLGFFKDFFVSVAEGSSYGGGPIESFVRLITQMNLTSKFSNEQGVAVQLMKTLDDGLEGGMRAVASVLPDFPSLSSATYVAQGYDIPDAVLGRQLLIALAYIIGLTIAGYFLLRTREVAK